ELRAMYNEYGIVDRFIKMEHLEHDLSSILQDLKIDFDRDIFISKSKTNTSKHHKASFYYDAETIALVNQQDQLLISAFNYETPSLT
ncbi:MAG: hypothetical protein ACTSQV_04755, partial [Alphaproteobacteria bacterium]